jgi:F-type H+-transporting ATPase subunit b
LIAFITALVVAQEAEHTNDPKDLYPHLNELIVGAVAFGVLFFFVSKWVLPRLGKILEERRQKIQGNLEEAERAKRDADQLLAEYRQKLHDAGTEAGKIIEEARKTAEQMRKDLIAKAEDESRQIVGKAQEEIRAERDRAVQSLRRELAEASVDLAGRVVGETLDKERHVRLVEQFIDEVNGMSSSNGNSKGS